MLVWLLGWYTFQKPLHLFTSTSESQWGIKQPKAKTSLCNVFISCRTASQGPVHSILNFIPVLNPPGTILWWGRALFWYLLYWGTRLSDVWDTSWCHPQLHPPRNQRRKEFSATSAMSCYLLIHPFFHPPVKSLKMSMTSKAGRTWEKPSSQQLQRLLGAGLQLVHVPIHTAGVIRDQCSSTMLQTHSALWLCPQTHPRDFQLL